MMRLKSYENTDILNARLCSDIVELIESAIATYGDCRILLSGGSTPRRLYAALGQTNLAWDNVYIGLVDDRCVPRTSEFSNAKLLDDTLLKSASPSPIFVPQVVDSDMEANLKKANALYAPFAERTDLCLLGMGGDGHTASLFPGDDASEANLQDDKTVELLYTTAPVEPKNRITTSKAFIERSQTIVVLITGEQKLDVLNNAQRNKLPIGYILESSPTKTTVYHTND